MPITVPAPQKLVSAYPNHVGGNFFYETADVRRAIPENKLAAVKAVLNTWGDESKWRIDYGGASGAARDGRGFRIRFRSMQPMANVSIFLADVETAITT